MKKQQKTHAGVCHRCGECGLGEWVLEFMHLDINGHPFVKICPHATWGMIKKQPATLRDNAACDKYVQKC